MSDNDEVKVNESKLSGNKKSLKKIDGNNGVEGSSRTNNKDDKIQSIGSSATTKSSPSPSSTSSTSATTKSSPSPSTQTISATTANVATSAANTSTNSNASARTQADAKHENSNQFQTSGVINSIAEYNDLTNGPLSVPKITSNYFCFDCGAILTTIEDKEQHLRIESERKNNVELTAEG